ncbi:MAG TPA: hypothetical protein PLZ62_01960 [bacterium]|nr:hypothetical protein [bacterium]
MDQEKRKIVVEGVEGYEQVDNSVDGVYNNAANQAPVVERFDDTQVYEWDAYEFEYHPKDKNWRWGLLGVVVLLMIILAVMKNWMGMVLVVAAGGVVYQYAYKQPRKLHYILTKDGLLVDEKVYAFDQVVSFWISQDGSLNLNTKWWPPRLTIELNSVDVEKMELFLAHYVKKVKREGNDTADNVSRWLKF